MCAIAQQRGAYVFQGDCCTYECPETFDAVLALFNVVNYLSIERDLGRGLANARRHLNSGGLFIFDTWFEDAVISEKPEIRVKRVTHDGLSVVRLAEPVWLPSRKSVEVNYTVFARSIGEKLWDLTQESHLLNYLSIDLLARLAEENGFNLVHVEEMMSGASPSCKTWNVCVVLVAH